MARLTKTEESGGFLTLADALTLWTLAVFAIGGVMYVTLAQWQSSGLLLGWSLPDRRCPPRVCA